MQELPPARSSALLVKLCWNKIAEDVSSLTCIMVVKQLLCFHFDVVLVRCRKMRHYNILALEMAMSVMGKCTTLLLEDLLQEC